MRWWTAILLTVVLAIVGLLLSFGLSFPVIWIMTTICALWAFWDSDKLRIRKYSSIFQLGPVFVFASIFLLWLFFFPTYLTVRGRIKRGIQAPSMSPACKRCATLLEVSADHCERCSPSPQVISEEGRIGILIENLKHDSAAVRQEAATILGDLGPVALQADAALQEAVRDQVLRVRTRAKWALEQLRRH